MDFLSRSTEIYVCDKIYKYTKTSKEISPECLKRIKALGIPSAYKKLWLAKDKNDNIQVIALDSKNKKQYFYSTDWIESRDATKFKRMYKFALMIPKLRSEVEIDKIKNPEGSKIRTMAFMITILDLTNIRIGNKKYLDQNESYGLTTLCKEHISFGKGVVHINFRGKHNVEQTLEINDEKIIKFIKKMMTLPTEWIMKYTSECKKEYYAVSAQDLNTYMHDKIGDFSCKDFRTYGANKTFVDNLKKLDTKSNLKKNISQALECTAEKLGNNKATSKKSYVMEGLMRKYLENPDFIISRPFEQLLKYFCSTKLNRTSK